MLALALFLMMAAAPIIVTAAIIEIRQYRMNRAFLSACRTHDNYRRES